MKDSRLISFYLVLTIIHDDFYAIACEVSALALLSIFIVCFCGDRFLLSLELLTWSFKYWGLILFLRNVTKMRRCYSLHINIMLAMILDSFLIRIFFTFWLSIQWIWLRMYILYSVSSILLSLLIFLTIFLKISFIDPFSSNIWQWKDLINILNHSYCSSIKPNRKDYPCNYIN